MDRKAKIREYKETLHPTDVYQIKNRLNGKVLIGLSVNLPAVLNRCKAELKMGSHRNMVLQKEWQQFGAENFEFKELEILEPGEDPMYNPAEDLHVLEALWVEKLSPFGDQGYNPLKNEPTKFCAAKASAPTDTSAIKKRTGDLAGRVCPVSTVLSTHEEIMK